MTRDESSIDTQLRRLAGEIDRLHEAGLARFANSLAGRGYSPDEIEQALSVPREMLAAERPEMLRKLVRFALQPDAPSLALN